MGVVQRLLNEFMGNVLLFWKKNFLVSLHKSKVIQVPHTHERII